MSQVVKEKLVEIDPELVMSDGTMGSTEVVDGRPFIFPVVQLGAPINKPMALVPVRMMELFLQVFKWPAKKE